MIHLLKENWVEWKWNLLIHVLNENRFFQNMDMKSDSIMHSLDLINIKNTTLWSVNKAFFIRITNDSINFNKKLSSSIFNEHNDYGIMECVGWRQKMCHWEIDIVHNAIKNIPWNVNINGIQITPVFYSHIHSCNY